MSTNQFDEVIVAFAKTIFESFDEIIDEIKHEPGWLVFTDELTKLGMMEHSNLYYTMSFSGMNWQLCSFNFIRFIKK